MQSTDMHLAETSPEIEADFSRDLVAAKISALGCVDEPGIEPLFYTIPEDGAAMVQGNTAHIWLPDGEVGQELLQGCRILGVEKVLSNRPTPNGKALAMLSCQGSGENGLDGETCDMLAAANLLHAGAEIAEPDYFYTEMHRRYRRGIARLWLFEENHTPVATAGVYTYHRASQTAVVEGVYTAPDHRGKRHAARLIEVMRAQVQGTLLLCCETSLIPFYTALGYEQCGEVWEETIA